MPPYNHGCPIKIIHFKHHDEKPQPTATVTFSNGNHEANEFRAPLLTLIIAWSIYDSLFRAQEG